MKTFQLNCKISVIILDDFFNLVAVKFLNKPIANTI